MICKLDIVTGFKNNRTYLVNYFFTRPFRIANITEDKSSPTLDIMLMSSSPGMLDGDDYDMKFHLQPHSSLQLLSQSYLRLFNMKVGARLQMRIQMDRDSSLSYVPHPIVPQEQSMFNGKNIFKLDDNCLLVFGEIITCGRKYYGQGEVFKYAHFQNLTEIYHQEKLILKDNILLQPQLVNVSAMGQLEGYTHQATLIYVQTGAPDEFDAVELIHDLLVKEEGISFGISRGAKGVVVLRILGHGGEQLYDCLQKGKKALWDLHAIGKQKSVEMAV